MAISSTHTAGEPLSLGFAATATRFCVVTRPVMITAKSPVCKESDGGVPGAYYISGELVLA